MVAALFAIEVLYLWHVYGVVNVAAGTEAETGNGEADDCSDSNCKNYPSVENEAVKIVVHV